MSDTPLTDRSESELRTATGFAGFCFAYDMEKLELEFNKLKKVADELENLRAKYKEVIEILDGWEATQ